AGRPLTTTNRPETGPDRAPEPVAPETAREVTAWLRRIGLAGPREEPLFTTLPGGVSSEIWRVDLARGPVCIKRAIAKLKVEQDWFAPIERSIYEVRWFRTAGAIEPGCVPEVLGVDEERHMFAMAFLDPATHRLWKSELRDGHADPAFAALVARKLVHIHAATAHRPDIAAQFPTDAIFHALRLESYLEATARRHADLAPRLHALVATTAKTKHALVHGDVSPKNIMIGPNGPVFLDAETAWYGDPAFDVAFCLNHLLLKCLWTPQAARGFLACFDALAETYLAGVAWEEPAEIEGRVAALVPGLFLARIDGKSPVEYVTREADKDRVRRVARPLIAAPPARLSQVRGAWAAEIGIV
ncbi:MAG TPA: phosphotransferase, partial [Alphaproteobacteria bacterium]